MPPGGQFLQPKSGGPTEWVPDSLIPSAVASGYYHDIDPSTPVAVTTADGTSAQIPLADLHRQQVGGGGHVQTGGEFRIAERGARLEREHGGLAGQIGTGLESGADAITLGGYGGLTRALLPESYTDSRRERAETNPAVDTVGAVAGTVLPALLTAGGSLGASAAGTAASIAGRTGVGLAARVGVSAAERLGGGILAKGVGFGLESAIVAGGTGAHEAFIAKDPVTIERVASAIGSNALVGAVGGFGLGVGGTLAGKAVGSMLRGPAATAVEEGAAKFKAASSIPDDLTPLVAAGDTKGLRVAEEVEKTRLKDVQVKAKADAAGGIAEYHALVDESNPWLATEKSKVLTRTKNTIVAHLDDPIGLQKDPEKVLVALRKQSEALRRSLEDAPVFTAKLAAEDVKIAEGVEELITRPSAADMVTLEGKAAKRWGQYTHGTGKDVEVTREQAAELMEALANGEIQGERAASLQRLPKLLEANQALQDRIEAAAAKEMTTTSERLTQIADAHDLIRSAPTKQPGLVEQIAQGTIFGAVTGAVAPFMGPASMAAPIVGAYVSKKVVGRLFGTMAKAGAESAERTARAVASFVDVGSRVAKGVPVLATKVLASVSFGDPPPVKASDFAAPTPREPKLLDEYRKREGELLSQVTAGPNGKPIVKPEARRKIAARLRPIAVHDPLLADQIETVAARRIEYLASKLQQRPDSVAMRLGPDRWQASDMAMRTFARHVSVVEDPGAAEERLAMGTFTPEDAEALQTVYPERYADLQRQIIEALPELRESLPYPRRLALSIFTGAPVDPAMEPRILRVLQGNFAAEEGTESGTAPPMAAPQYASIKKSIPEPTPGQSRAG